MGSHFDTGPAELTIAVVDSFTRDRRWAAQALPTSRQVGYNVVLGNPTRAIYIGGSGNYRLFVREAGASPGEVTPYYDIAGGIWHPITAVEIINSSTYENDAPNILLATQ